VVRGTAWDCRVRKRMPPEFLVPPEGCLCPETATWHFSQRYLEIQVTLRDKTRCNRVIRGGNSELVGLQLVICVHLLMTLSKPTAFVYIGRSSPRRGDGHPL